nr:5'-AMP-activated serine/threonine-protein kinase catalytic subunit alpha-like [Drosophila bipectinata]
MTPHLTALGLKPLTVEKRASPISTTTNTGAVSLVTKMNASACYKSLGIIKRLRSLSPSNAFSPEKRLLLDEAPAKTNNDKDTPIRSPPSLHSPVNSALTANSTISVNSQNNNAKSNENVVNSPLNLNNRITHVDINSNNIPNAHNETGAMGVSDGTKVKIQSVQLLRNFFSELNNFATANHAKPSNPTKPATPLPSTCPK